MDLDELLDKLFGNTDKENEDRKNLKVYLKFKDDIDDVIIKYQKDLSAPYMAGGLIESGVFICLDCAPTRKQSNDSIKEFIMNAVKIYDKSEEE